MITKRLSRRLNYLEHSANVHNGWEVNKETSNIWYKNLKKREEQEVQNTLILKSEEKGWKRKSQQFQEYEYYK